MVRPNLLNTHGVPDSLPPFAKNQSPKSYLFTSIVKKYLGEQAAYIYALLLTNERLSLKRLSIASKFKPQHLRQVLVALIQMNCVVYYPKNGGASSNSKNGSTPLEYYYYPEDEGCLKLLHADDIIRTIRHEYDDDVDALAATVVQNVLSVGHLTVTEFLDPLPADKPRRQAFLKIFGRLVQDGWLLPIGRHSFENQYDLFSKMFKTCTAEFNRENPATKTLSQTKRMQMIKELTAERYLKMLDSVTAASAALDTSGVNHFGDDGGDYGDDDGDDDDGHHTTLVNTSIPLTFNLERYLKRLRSVHLVSETRHRIGQVSAKVYALALHRIENKSRDVRSRDARLARLLANVGTTTVGYDPAEDKDLRTRLALRDQSAGLNFNIQDIARELELCGSKLGVSPSDLNGTIYDATAASSSSLAVAGATKRLSSDFGRASKRVKIDVKIEDSDDEDDEVSFSTTSGVSASTILQHLKLLANDQALPFLKETSPGSFYVPFTDLLPVFTRHTFKQYLKQILGSPCLRIFNCIEKKKLTDEKTLAKLILMRESNIRTDLNKMQEFRIVEFQEIPKTQDRSAMRASYAFRPKYESGLQTMRNSLIFNMGEALEYLDNLRLDHKILLDKVSREDVRGKEQDLLLTSELEQLQKYQESEKLGLAKFGRLRSAVDVFYFFSGV